MSEGSQWGCKLDLLAGESRGGGSGGTAGSEWSFGCVALFMHLPRFWGINPFYLLWICYLPVLASVITLCHCYSNDRSENNSASLQQPSRVCIIASVQVTLDNTWGLWYLQTFCFSLNVFAFRFQKIRFQSLVTKIVNHRARNLHV